MKNSLTPFRTEEYRIPEYAGTSGLVLSVHCPRLRYEKEISFSSLFSSASLFFTFNIFDTPADYRIAMPEFLLSRISITVSAAVRIFRKTAAPLRRLLNKVARPGTVRPVPCVLRL